MSAQKRRRHAYRRLGLSDLAFIGFLVLWQLVVMITQVKRFVLPQPLQVLERGYGVS